MPTDESKRDTAYEAALNDHYGVSGLGDEILDALEVAVHGGRVWEHVNRTHLGLVFIEVGEERDGTGLLGLDESRGLLLRHPEGLELTLLDAVPADEDDWLGHAISHFYRQSVPHVRPMGRQDPIWWCFTPCRPSLVS